MFVRYIKIRCQGCYWIIRKRVNHLLFSRVVSKQGIFKIMTIKQVCVQSTKQHVCLQLQEVAFFELITLKLLAYLFVEIEKTLVYIWGLWFFYCQSCCEVLVLKHRFPFLSVANVIIFFQTLTVSFVMILGKDEGCYLEDEIVPNIASNVIIISLWSS